MMRGAYAVVDSIRKKARPLPLRVFQTFFGN